jgi:ribosomal protein S16
MNLKTAFYACTYMVQYTVYHMVIADLKSSRDGKKSNELHSLCPFLDEHEMLRVVG